MKDDIKKQDSLKIDDSLRQRVMQGCDREEGSSRMEFLTGASESNFEKKIERITNLFIETRATAVLLNGEQILRNHFAEKAGH